MLTIKVFYDFKVGNLIDIMPSKEVLPKPKGVLPKSPHFIEELTQLFTYLAYPNHWFVLKLYLLFLQFELEFMDKSWSNFEKLE